MAVSKAADHFSLDRLEKPLEEFQPPTGPFDPKGDWQLAYGVYTVARGSARVGQLRLRRRVADEGAVLTLDYEKLAAGKYRQRVAAQIRCRQDALSTPMRWTFRSELLDPHGRPLEHTRLEKQAAVKDTTIEITDGTRTRRLDRPAAFTVNWALFDAIQRLPHKPFKPLAFTLIDHFDQPKPEHTLAYRESIDVLLGGKRVQKQQVRELEKGRIRTTVWAREGQRQVRLHGYDHLGRGIVPWVYWVDDRGCLLFALSGLEAYALEPPKKGGGQRP